MTGLYAFKSNIFIKRQLIVTKGVEIKNYICFKYRSKDKLNFHKQAHICDTLRKNMYMY